jgi:hypothetical protein
MFGIRDELNCAGSSFLRPGTRQAKTPTKMNEE